MPDLGPAFSSAVAFSLVILERRWLSLEVGRAAEVWADDVLGVDEDVIAALPRAGPLLGQLRQRDDVADPTMHVGYPDSTITVRLLPLFYWLKKVQRHHAMICFYRRNKKKGDIGALCSNRQSGLKPGLRCGPKA